MKSSVTNLIETLIILSDDEQPEVEKLANESVNKLNNIFDGKNKKSLIEILEESFYVLLSRIPRVIITSSKTCYFILYVVTFYLFISFIIVCMYICIFRLY